MTMSIAVGQFAAGLDVGQNTDQCRHLIARAGETGADLAVLPEVAMYFDPRHADGPGPHGQALDGPFVTAMTQAARQAGIAVLVGMVERSDEAARDYNTLVAISAAGDLLGSYRKVHLYDAFGFRESEVYVPGEIGTPLVFQVGDVTVGAVTCYDLRFPEIFRWVVDAGAEAVAVPAAWIAGPSKEHHWATLLAARAIENTVYVAGADQTGPVSCGQSMVVDPMGAVVASAAEAPGLAVATVDPARVRAVRHTNPSLANRRFTVAALEPARS